MKKLFLGTICTIALMFVSCTSADSLLDDYSEACKNGDYVKMSKIAKKLEKKDLTQEQALRFQEISSECASSTISNF